MLDYIIIDENDNVGVALKDMEKGYTLESPYGILPLKENIPAGHKFALKDISDSEPIIKYGYTIGYATGKITAGCHVHTDNLSTSLDVILSYTYNPDYSYPDYLLPETGKNAFFNGYRRKDGKAGIRNQIWIVPAVGCVNSVALALERKASFLVGGSLEGIAAFTHPCGCDQDNTIKILAGLIDHPNAAGVLVLGLGCENCNIEVLRSHIRSLDMERVKFLQCQDAEDEIEEGLRLLKELADYAKQFNREPVETKELTVGLICGGSDRFSGITANPLVGDFSDFLISMQGTAILTEVPEMFGAESIMMKRCRNEEVFNKTVSMINSFKDYYIRHEQPIYDNLSTESKNGGITAMKEKALGCIQKAGKAPVADTLSYGEPATKKGLNLLCAPCNDLVAATALAASGAQLILFTTGMGTPFGSCVPTIKISSNSRLAQAKKNWIDFDAGRLLYGADRKDMAKELFAFVMEVASGRKVKAEEAGYHDIAIWKQGVTL